MKILEVLRTLMNRKFTQFRKVHSSSKSTFKFVSYKEYRVKNLKYDNWVNIYLQKKIYGFYKNPYKTPKID